MATMERKSAQQRAAPLPSGRQAPRRLPWKTLAEGHEKIVDLMAAGTPLKEMLTAIAQLVERLAPSALCSILLLQPDGRHLRHGAGPSLPDQYNQAINDLEIGPSVGSCGTAAYCKKPVIVSDIATDPLWEGPREFALSFGLRACWSMPIVGGDGVVLGTIAMYHRQPRAPSKRQLDLLKSCGALVRLALTQHRKEEELRAAEAHSRLAADAAGLGTYHIDLATEAVTWSPRLKEIMGLPPDAAVNRATFESLIHPDDVPLMQRRYQRWINAEIHTPRNVEYRVIRKSDGAERIISLRGRVLTNAYGVPVSAIGVCADVTEQHFAEQKQRDVQRQIHELQKMEAVGQLAGGIAHDLNNTLMPILGLSTLALQELSPRDPVAEHLALIHRSGERARALVNQILTFSRKEEIARGPVALATLVAESVPLMRVGLPAAIAIETEIAGNPVIWANRGQIDQVLTNLLTNAVQAIGTSAGKIRIELGIDAAKKMARLAVIDDGPGIDPASLNRLFEPFFTTKKVGDGTGLGLAVAHGIVANHGGRIEVSSRLGEGATFQVLLPLFQHAASPAASANA